MAEVLVESVQSMLKEETWTRATISNYTQNNLKELAAIVEQARNENLVDELQQICDEHLLHAKDSIIALYLSGMFALQKGSLDNTQLITLIDIFQKNHKENIVAYLCETILEDDPNNKFALRILANSFAEQKNEQYWDLCKKIIKVDFSEADLAKVLATHYEDLLKDNPEDANLKEEVIEYYKKALLRYINNMNYSGATEMWGKLISYIPDNIDFFQLAKRKLAKAFGDQNTVTPMENLYEYYKDSQQWDIAIDIVKQILEIEPNSIRLRKSLIECYKGKYANHSQLESCIKASNIEQNYRNVFEAITDFEKHIAFDKKSFVFHNNWGVGKIMDIEKQNDTNLGEKLIINFGRHGVHPISLKLAVNSLQPLAKDHIWVLKATKKKEDLLAMIEKDKKGILEIVIKSFDNNCDFKRIKAELSPILDKKWTSWSVAAKKLLETEPTFGVNPNNINMYTVRKTDISPEEKLRNEFTAQKQFFARVDIIMKYFYSKSTDNSNEFFADMYSYFTSILKNISHVNEQTIAAYLVVREFSAEDKQFMFPVKETFMELYNRIEDPRKLYENLKDTKNTNLRKSFLSCIEQNLANWADEFIKLFPVVLDMSLLESLVSKGHTEEVQKLVCKSFEMFKDYRESVLFFFKECQDKDWFKEAGVSYEKQLITLLNIVELTYREINSHVNSTENKKINTNAKKMLFDNGTLFDYMFTKDENTVMKFYTLIDDIVDLDAKYKEQARAKVHEHYPNIKFRVTEDQSKQSNALIVTMAKLSEKKAELENIKTVEIPKNNIEVSEAHAKGDLKENHEYKAAKEKQERLNKELSKLTTELSRAVVFDPSTVNTTAISFGTKATLKNNKTGKEEVFTILGPWESDPDNNIYSYVSPLGMQCLNRRVDETFVISVNDTDSTEYTVLSIEKADF